MREISPGVFARLSDGLVYVCEGQMIYAEANGNRQGADGIATVPAGMEDLVREAAEECQGECIHIEA